MQEQQKDNPIIDLSSPDHDAPEFISVECFERVQGQCKEFISEEEKSWRTIDILEKYPFQRIAKYQRNKSYQPHNTRDPLTLNQSLTYLMQSLPKFISVSKQKVWLFLQQCIKAIRCQFYVQGIFPPRQLLQINKALITANLMNTSTISPLAYQSYELPRVDFGNMLQMLTDYKQELMKSFKVEYEQMLICMIFTCSKMELGKILIEHEYIIEDERMAGYLQLRLKVDHNMWSAYFNALQNQSMLIRVLLLLRLRDMQQYLLKVLPKIYMKVSKQDLQKWMGWEINEDDAWVDVRKQGWIKKPAHREWLQASDVIAFLSK